MNKVKSSCLYLFFLVFSAQSLSAENRPPVSQNRVSLMSYNLENLFDWEHDKDKNDLTYLPLDQKQNAAQRYLCGQIRRKKWRTQCLEFDWSEKNARVKMQRLASVVMSVNDGRGPDILILQEIENLNILNIFKKEYLAKANYQTAVLIEGRDKRGIDVALLSRLQQGGEAQNHYVPFKKIKDKQLKDTRPILEVPLLLPGGKKLHVFGVHFPAPYHPWQLRRQAFKHLNGLIAELPDTSMAVAGGDFNVPADEEEARELFKKTAGKQWQVAFYEGCGTCIGTYYYPPLKQWSFLDSLIFRKDQKSGWFLDPQSIKVIKSKKQIDNQGFPRSYDPGNDAGISDHLPIYAEIATK